MTKMFANITITSYGRYDNLLSSITNVDIAIAKSSVVRNMYETYSAKNNNGKNPSPPLLETGITVVWVGTYNHK